MAKGVLRADRRRIGVTCDIETWEKIKAIADKNDKSMSEVCLKWCLEGLNGTLNSDNLEFIVPIIREQLRDVLQPSVERLASLSAKTCVQAGAAAYLSAECMSCFVPPQDRMEFGEAYTRARKKAVSYTQSHRNIILDDVENEGDY